MTPGHPAGTPLSELSSRAAIVSTMQAMAAATSNSTALPGPSYDLCFPILEAVLSSAVHTSLHEQALQVMALHVAPGLPLPRKETLAVLYHVLGVVPAYRSVQHPGTDGHGHGHGQATFDSLQYLMALPQISVTARSACNCSTVSLLLLHCLAVLLLMHCSPHPTRSSA